MSSRTLCEGLFGAAGKPSKPSKPSQAAKALKATKQGTWKRSKKPRRTVIFHRPQTLKHTREPKYPRQRSASATAAQAAPHCYIGAQGA